MPDRWDIIHVGMGLILAALAILSLECGWRWLGAGIVAGIVDLYLLIVLWEAAQRRAAGYKIFAFPHRSWSILFVFLLLISLICSFADMYIKSMGVQHGSGEILADHGDAVYFSTVTITTLGYGDYAPINKCARRIVIWELGSGFLLLLLTVPVLASRLADWSQRQASR